MKTARVTAYTANTANWRKQAQTMKPYYAAESSRSGGSPDDEAAEPGHKDRFDAMLKRAAKPKRSADQT